LSTIASGGGQRNASIRLLQLSIDVPGVTVIELGLQVTHLGQQGVVVRVRVGQLGGDLVEAVQLLLVSPTPSSTFSSTVLPSVSGGSCSRIPTVAPSASRASPLEAVEPAMILNSEDLPVPFGRPRRSSRR